MVVQKGLHILFCYFCFRLFLSPFGYKKQVQAGDKIPEIIKYSIVALGVLYWESTVLLYHLNFLFIFIYLRGRASIHWFPSQMPSEFQEAKVQGRKLNPGPSRGWEESSYLSHHQCLLCSALAGSRSSAPGVEPRPSNVGMWDTGTGIPSARPKAYLCCHFLLPFIV